MSDDRMFIILRAPGGVLSSRFVKPIHARNGPFQDLLPIFDMSERTVTARTFLWGLISCSFVFCIFWCFSFFLRSAGEVR